MAYSVKDYNELLELIRSQEGVISKQNKIIETLTNKNLELENFIESVGIEQKEKQYN